jgi:hypothetical protein
VDGWIVKVPFPLQGGRRAVALHVPEILPLVRVPWRFIIGPPTSGETIDIPNASLAGVNVPCAPGSFDNKHAPGFVNVRLVMFKTVPLPWVNVAENW